MAPDSNHEPGRANLALEARAAPNPRLLPDHLSLVNLRARQIHRRLPRHVLLEDLINAGVIGLIDAIHKFDRTKHVQFNTYAKFRIRGAILDSLRELDWGSRAIRRQARRISDTQERVTVALGRLPTQAEIAEALGLPLQEFQLLCSRIHALETVSVSHSWPLDERDQDRSEQLPSNPENTPYHECLRGEMHELLELTMQYLPCKERQVVRLYYFQDLTMQEIGMRMGLGESRISQLHSAAIAHLRARLADLGTQETRPLTRSTRQNAAY